MGKKRMSAMEPYDDITDDESDSNGTGSTGTQNSHPNTHNHSKPQTKLEERWFSR